MKMNEAVTMLERMQNPEPYESQITEEAYEALEMAIRALQQIPVKENSMDDLISRRAAIDTLEWKLAGKAAIDAIKNLPSAKPEYEPVKAEDFAKTMSENTLYGFMAWRGEAFELMERQGFVICKKTL